MAGERNEEQRDSAEALRNAEPGLKAPCFYLIKHWLTIQKEIL